jgi:Uma2 family endonuclease
MAEARRDDIAELRELQDALDLPGHRVELLEGRLVVSPAPIHWHNRAVMWLIGQFSEVCEARDWFQSGHSGLELPPTQERIEPDLLILRDAGQLPDEESYLPVRPVLLVAEVVSRSSKREDREVKPRGCALAGIPFYLLVDRYVDGEPVTVTLYGDPGEGGYASTDAVAHGGKLAIPDPFGMILDTSALPLPRKPGPAAPA